MLNNRAAFLPFYGGGMSPISPVARMWRRTSVTPTTWSVTLTIIHHTCTTDHLVKFLAIYNVLRNVMINEVWNDVDLPAVF